MYVLCKDQQNETLEVVLINSSSESYLVYKSCSVQSVKFLKINVICKFLF